MSTLVLGAAVGYSPTQAAPFIKSLRNVGYRGDVALIVERESLAAFRAAADMGGVAFLGAAQWPARKHPSLERGRRRRWMWRPLQTTLWLTMRALDVLPESVCRGPQALLVQYLMPPTEARFLRFLRVIERGSWTRVLIADVRDVLFQTEPFAQLPRSGLAIGMEPAHYTIATETWNATKVREIYGAAMLQRIGARPVSCSGVTAGDRTAILEYLRLMAREIVGLRRVNALQGWFDQALHNVVVWTRWGLELHRLETLASPIATLGAIPETDVRRDALGRILNRDGEAPAVVHQYDRLPTLRDDLPRRLTGTPA